MMDEVQKKKIVSLC